MREILFRAWDKTENKYKKFDGMHDTMTISREGKVEYYNLQNGSGGDEYILEQFTGLTDKHGRKIYEGDIVVTCPSTLSISDGGSPSRKMTVEGRVFLDMCISALYRKHTKFYKVIGNIHDQKEDV